MYLVEVSFAFILLKYNFSMKMFKLLIKHGVSFQQREKAFHYFYCCCHSLLCKHYKEVLMGLNSRFIIFFSPLSLPPPTPPVEKKKERRSSSRK